MCEQYPLFCPKPQSLSEAGLVAIMEPRRQSLCGCEQIHVARNEAGVYVIVGLLNFRILQSRLLIHGCVREPVDVNNVYQLNRSIRVHTSLTRMEGIGAQVAR